ncbi:MAG TPA: DUF1761 domain-containing protein [Gemmatimonadaceae bacterium]|nr:DUF1761 domain-containing protein [Gemmatimonadaceae bacterium]
MPFPPVNWLAILVAAIVIFILGGLWYSPVLFSKKWMALQNKTEEQARAEMASANMPLMYASAFVTGFIIAAVMAHLLSHMMEGTNHVMHPGVHHGAMFGFLCWLGFAAPTSYATALFSGKPKQLWFIDSAYNLVSFVLAGIILGAWR